MEKSIPLAAGMESRQETGSQSVSINSNPRAQDFHPTDAFRIVKHPSLWAAWVHVFAPSFITPFPGKEQGLWGPCARCTCFPFCVSANQRGGALTGHLACITDISLDKWTLLPLREPLCLDDLQAWQSPAEHPAAEGETAVGFTVWLEGKLPDLK